MDSVTAIVCIFAIICGAISVLGIYKARNSFEIHLQNAKDEPIKDADPMVKIDAKFTMVWKDIDGREHTANVASFYVRKSIVDKALRADGTINFKSLLGPLALNSPQ